MNVIELHGMATFQIDVTQLHRLAERRNRPWSRRKRVLRAGFHGLFSLWTTMGRKKEQIGTYPLPGKFFSAYAQSRAHFSYPPATYLEKT